MINGQSSESTGEWLTPLQADFLAHFFATETGQRFFLTGGTALAAFYLHHRLSVDLDLFTLDDLAFREAGILVPQLAADLRCNIGQAQPFFLAGALRQVRHLQYLPVTTPSLAASDLQTFTLALADRLLDRLRPPDMDS